MSPALQGNLEVEHYTGSTLISSYARVNNAKNKNERKQEEKLVLQRPNVNQNCLGVCSRHARNCAVPNLLPPCRCKNEPLKPSQFNIAGWVGLPLISVVGKRKSQYQDHPLNINLENDPSLKNPLFKLALHTQGAPLIFTGRCYNGRKNQYKSNQIRGSCGEVIRRSSKSKENLSHGRRATSDCLSVASDESSGSGHSENCLPRIIKPRKRRKKDRKASISSADNDKAGSNESNVKSEKKSENNVLSCKNTLQKCVEYVSIPIVGANLTRSQKVESLEDESYGLKLHHNFEDVTESELTSFGCMPSSCQCHYCDPSGIWKTPSDLISKRETFLTPPYHFKKSFHNFFYSDLVLRRSWSEPIADSQIADKIIRSNFCVLPLRSNSCSETKRLRDWQQKLNDNGWKSSVMSGVKENYLSKSEECNKIKENQHVNKNYGSQCLEVSTEIVTSPNGHRDIEIRFYSASLPT